MTTRTAKPAKYEMTDARRAEFDRRWVAYNQRIGVLPVLVTARPNLRIVK